MSPSKPVAHTLRPCCAIHANIVERDVGLWGSDASSSVRRALAGHLETIAPPCRAAIGLKSQIPAVRHAARQASTRPGFSAGKAPLIKLRGSSPLAIDLAHPAHPDVAPEHGEAPCRAGDATDFAAYAGSEAEAPFQLDRCHARRGNRAGINQFYPCGHGRALRSKRAAQACRVGNEVQSNSQT